MSTGRRRRIRGEGTIYQRQDGRWVGAAWLPAAGGLEKRKLVYARTQAEALQKLRKLQAAAEAGMVLPTREWRVGDYLDHWLEHTVKPNRRPKTHQGYELAVRRHIKPVLGRRRLSALRVVEVKQMVDGMVERGYGTRMVQQVHSVLRNALQSAMRDELLTRNVASLVRVKTPTYDIGRGLSVEQSRTLIASTKGHRLQAAIVIALYLGLRRAEVLGLRWLDVDLDAGRLEVTQTLQRVEGRLQLLPPKTRRSRRTYPLPAPCVVALKAYRVAQGRERLAAGDVWTDSGMVFTTTVGTPVDPDNFSRTWERMRTVLGDPPVRFHDLRHTCVTLLLDAGVPPHIVRDVVGHSALDVTMSIYAHVSLDEKRTALLKLEDRLG